MTTEESCHTAGISSDQVDAVISRCAESEDSRVASEIADAGGYVTIKLSLCTNTATGTVNLPVDNLRRRVVEAMANTTDSRPSNLMRVESVVILEAFNSMGTVRLDCEVHGKSVSAMTQLSAVEGEAYNFLYLIHPGENDPTVFPTDSHCKAQSASEFEIEMAHRYVFATSWATDFKDVAPDSAQVEYILSRPGCRTPTMVKDYEANVYSNWILGTMKGNMRRNSHTVTPTGNIVILAERFHNEPSIQWVSTRVTRTFHKWMMARFLPRPDGVCPSGSDSIVNLLPANGTAIVFTLTTTEQTEPPPQGECSVVVELTLQFV